MQQKALLAFFVVGGKALRTSLAIGPACPCGERESAPPPLSRTSAQTAGGQIIRDTSPLVQGPLRVSVGVGTEEIGADVGRAIGQPTFDQGFVRLNEILASNFKAALFTQTEVKLTIQKGAHHNAQFWGDRFPAAIEFLFPPLP